MDARHYVARLLGSSALEEFPFPDLEFVATVTALFVALLILTTQRHEQELAEKRARLTLQIAVLSEKKIAKLIDLESSAAITLCCRQGSIQRPRNGDRERSALQPRATRSVRSAG